MKPGKIKAILLDLDDTLIDHAQAARDGVEMLRARHLQRMPPAEAAGIWEAGYARHFDRYVRGELSYQEQKRERIRDLFGNPLLTDAAADVYFRGYYEGYLRSCALFPDVRPFLERHRGYPLGLVTNGQGSQQRRKLSDAGITSLFASITISAEAGLRKPQPEIFLLAIKGLGVAPEECLFIGDNYQADYLGSKAAGMRPVLLDRKNTGAAEGVTRISGLDEILALLAG
jgi:putative hydrolase of the HAD superfamily